MIILVTERKHNLHSVTNHTEKQNKDRVLSSIASEAVREVFSSRPSSTGPGFGPNITVPPPPINYSLSEYGLKNYDFQKFQHYFVVFSRKCALGGLKATELGFLGGLKNHEYGPQLASFCRIETLVPSK